jgi:hypothetical protein
VDNEHIITDAEIEAAFEGTNFGTAIPRRLLEQGVLKALTGYHSGHTLTTIMRKLGLLTHRSDRVTAKGKRFVFWAFHRTEHSG